MMVANSTAHLFTSPSILSSSHSTTPTVTLSRSGALNFLPSRPKKKLISITASSSSSDIENAQGPSSSEPPKKKNPIAVLLEVPKTLWRQTLRPLSDFGFGRRSIWEGGVGLFLVSGTVLLALSLVWLRGFQLRSKFRKYLAVFEFSQACGISTGTPVRIRGVSVGNVIRVNPSLKCIEAVVEVEDDKTIIPRNALIEVNQSGLLMETVIDITPRDPIPRPSVGPLDAGCVKEGLIVCDRERLKGVQGVSLDALVGIFTRIGREVEEIGVTNTYLLAERAAAVIEEARPLLLKLRGDTENIGTVERIRLNQFIFLGDFTRSVSTGRIFWLTKEKWPSYLILEGVIIVSDEQSALPNFGHAFVTVGASTLILDTKQQIILECSVKKIKAMADDLQPLLAEVRDSGLLKEVECLTKSLTEASEDLRKGHSSVMTPENTELIQKSIYNLIFTLKNIESISSDILGFTGDEATRKNLKLVIKSLSRLL